MLFLSHDYVALLLRQRIVKESIETTCDALALSAKTSYRWPYNIIKQQSNPLANLAESYLISSKRSQRFGDKGRASDCYEGINWAIKQCNLGIS